MSKSRKLPPVFKRLHFAVVVVNVQLLMVYTVVLNLNLKLKIPQLKIKRVPVFRHLCFSHEEASPA